MNDSILNDDTDVFEDTVETQETDMVFLTADNSDDLLGRFIKPYPFPTEPGRPREGFHVRMATVEVLKRFEDLRSNKSSSDNQRFKAMCELIADSVCDPNGQPIWNEEQVKTLGKSNVPRFNRMMHAVLDRNGQAKLEDLIEEAEKN